MSLIRSVSSDSKAFTGGLVALESGPMITFMKLAFMLVTCPSMSWGAPECDSLLRQVTAHLSNAAADVLDVCVCGPFLEGS